MLGMNYKVYYVIIAWEWFLCVFSVCFWIGCKWIKKGGLCARGWENREPFFIDLLWGKQVLKTHKIPLVRWGASDGWVKLLQRSVPISFYLKLAKWSKQRIDARKLGLEAIFVQLNEIINLSK